MKHNPNKAILYIVSLAIVLLPRFAHGIGYEITEQDAKAMGLASAFAAWADNPSAIYYNPAGLSQIDEPEASLGVTLIGVNLRLSNSGDREDDKTQDFYIPNFYFSIPLNVSDLTFGLGVYSPYGLGTEWDKDGITKYAAIKSDLRTIYITPVLAWQATPEISVAAGLSYIYADAEMTRKYPFSAIGFPSDADVKLTGKDHNWGWTAGILAQPTDKLSLGFSYRSKTKLNLEGDFDVDGTPTGAPSHHTDVELELPLPHRFSFGINYKLLPNWRVELDYERIFWSAVDSFDVNIDEENDFYKDTKTEKDWRDTNAFKLGTEVQVTENWALRAGGFYYQSAIPDHSLEPMIPENDRYGFTLGVGYQIGDFIVDVGYMEIFSDPRTVNNDSLEANSALLQGLSPGDDRYETHFREAALQINYIF